MGGKVENDYWDTFATLDLGEEEEEEDEEDQAEDVELTDFEKRAVIRRLKKSYGPYVGCGGLDNP